MKGMSFMRKYFGTDGIRRIANTELTPELVYKVAKSGAYVLSKHTNHVPTILIGRDTRLSGTLIESAMVAGFLSYGANVKLLGVIPTPAVAYLTRKYNADCGVVISASHNPMEDNGIKFFNKDGFKLDDAIELEIEKYIENIDKVDCNPVGENVGVINHEHNALRDYVDYLKSIINVDLTGMKVVLDCANGASYEVAPTVFKELGANVIDINTTPNGKNINDKCGSTHPEMLQKAVVENKADLGLAYDGDADRLIAVDENGNIVDGDHIMILSAVYLKKKNQLSNNTLVITVMTNIGLNVAAREHGINLETTDVGDRYVIEAMKKGEFNLGGEQSGHMIFSDYNTTGDGVLSSLMLSKIIMEEKKPLSELASIMSVYPQVLVNVEVKNEVKNKFMEVEEIKNEITRIEELMEGSGRVLIRPSGTQPLVRVMLEGKEEGQINELANNLANLIKEKLS